MTCAVTRLYSLFHLLTKTCRLVYTASPRTLLFLLTIGIAQAVVPLTVAWITKGIYDHLSDYLATPEQAVLRLLWVLVAVQVAVNVVNTSLTPLNAFLNSYLVRRTSRLIQMQLLEKVESLDGLAHFENPQLHDDLRVILHGTQMAPTRLVSLLLNTTPALVTILGFVGLLFRLSPVLGLLIFAVALPQLLIYSKLTALRMKLYASFSPVERMVNYLINHFTDPVKVKEMKIYDFGHHFLTEVNDRIDQTNRVRTAQDRMTLGWSVLLQIPMTLLSTAAFVIAVSQVVAGHFTLGDVALYTMAVVSVYSALATVASGFAEAGEGLAYLNQLQLFLKTPQALTTSGAPGTAGPLEHAIRFQQVWFRYAEDQDWVLRDVSFDLQKGESVAIVGLNGAGKSTMIKLMARLYNPTEGCITWDGTDLRCYTPRSVRKHLSIVFQDFVRYDLTAAENIGLGKVEHLKNESKLAHAARQSGIDELLNSLPGGYQTLLSRQFGETTKGFDLSGGQWQRLAISRALVRDTEVLILDEPSAALDAEAEQDLYQRLQAMAHQKTVVVVTHRLSVARMMDKIIVLDGGALVQSGSHDTLMAEGGRYAELFQVQAEHYRSGPGPVVLASRT